MPRPAPGALAALTTVPGHSKKSDKNGNGIPDAGIMVNGHYTSLYAYDGLGQWYWDLGDGRVYGTVTTLSALDQSSLTSCRYVNRPLTAPWKDSCNSSTNSRTW